MNRLRKFAGSAVLALCGLVVAPFSGASDIPRTADGKPDLSGTYDISTATPLERPVKLGDKKVLSESEAQALAQRMATILRSSNAASDPDRSPPPVGGNVGAYNAFYIDMGETAIRVNGEYRTSVITEPADGRIPALTLAGHQRAEKFNREIVDRPGAWWLLGTDPGPFDHPESLTVVDRCLLGRGVPGGPPVLPTIYNNVKRIVQTPDYVMILIEMVHDARIIRLNSEHGDPSIRKWLGDSIGWWEGDTLVVDTTNFNDTPSLTGASRDLHVVERFQRIDADTLLYSFTVNDPASFAEPWGGEYPWPATGDLLYEYACHEANYAMGHMLQSARQLEREARDRAETNSGR